MSTAAPLAALREDLAHGSRDARYRAASFVARQGGPGLPQAAADAAALDAARPTLLAWLDAQPDPQALAQAYVQFVEHWSPVFRP